MRYELQWERGPSAVIDVQQQVDAFLLRYDSPFRLTLRPMLEAPGTPDDLQEPVSRLRQIAASTGISAARGGAPPLPREEVLASLSDSGDWLCRTIVPRFVAAELASQPIFLEIGTDEQLLDVPFELMRDDADFVCLRHSMGRYVNLGSAAEMGRRRETKGDLSVLLICVPKPQPIGGMIYERLDEAEAEFTSVSRLLVARGVDVLTLYGPDATKNAVMRALKGQHHHTVIHFTGHGHVDEAKPHKSGLVLFDGILSIGEIAAHLDNAPALAFINGCETAASAPVVAGAPLLPTAHLTRVFGIARPFLERGSYVLGTRWRVEDTTSAAFAEAFYTSLLDGDPVGASVTKARQAVYDPESADLSWASYVFYGDPRLVIRLEDAAPAPQGTPAPTPSSPGFALAPVEPPATPAVSADPGVVGPEAATAALADLATQYEQIMGLEPASAERTLRLERLIQLIGAEASRLAAPAIDLLASAADGDRIVGVVAARTEPHPDLATPLLAVLGAPRTNFEEYQVLKTLVTVVDSFDETQRDTVRDVVLAKLEDDEFLGSDRAILARDLLTKVPAPATG
ncbi:MAG TPA: CHAT domain-containing protein [Propionibacteriaceae bacterium]|nr:CHAT domain-containing protein [Propionibacteriaceae bacterium]